MGGLLSKGNHLDEVVFLSNQNITASDLGIIQKDTECKEFLYFILSKTSFLQTILQNDFELYDMRDNTHPLDITTLYFI